MNILIIHQHYLLAKQGGGSRFNEMARFWSQAGHSVTVIAGSLPYTTGRVPSRYRGRWVVRERDGDVTVYRCHVPESYSRSFVGRMWAFFGFTLSAASAVTRVPPPDVVIATSPPLIVVLPAWLATWLRGRRVPWVFEIRDLWPESAVTTGVLSRDSFLTRALYWLEAWACRASTRISVLTPAFRNDLRKRGLAEESKIDFVPNGADVRIFRPESKYGSVRDNLEWGRRFVVLYAGAHGRANAIGQLVDAAEHLRDRPDILIASVGDGPDRLRWQREAFRRGLDNLIFYGAQPKSAMPGLVNACDVGAAVLQDNPTFRTVYPNKVFDYMACARPILLAIDGAARQLVCTEARAGVFAVPEDGQSLSEAIRRLADNPVECDKMGLNGYTWVQANASRELLASRYLSILEQLVARESSHGRDGVRSAGRSSGENIRPDTAVM